MDTQTLALCSKVAPCNSTQHRTVSRNWTSADNVRRHARTNRPPHAYIANAPVL